MSVMNGPVVLFHKNHIVTVWISAFFVHKKKKSVADLEGSQLLFWDSP